MKRILFEIPIWKGLVDCEKIELISKDFKESFESQTITSFNGTNSISNQGKNYLFNNFIELLSEDVNIKNICNFKIWRNIYKNSFQDKHNHAGCHFSFVIYEKINKPQTVFFHPSNDLIAASRSRSLFKTSVLLDVQENNLVIFPGYLDHMVKLTEEALTISGNFDIEALDKLN